MYIGPYPSTSKPIIFISNVSSKNEKNTSSHTSGYGIFCTLDIVSGDCIVQQKFLFHNLFSPLCLLGEIEIKVHGSYISINII